MVFRLLLASVISLALASHGNEADALRGLESSKAGLYKNSKEFKCLDGTLTIPASQVNDDYCDCPDGSDEPGTSACPNGRFYCRNRGHVGHYMPSSRVNDGLCDCCDGSDEYASSSECPNICDELGKSARIEKERLAGIARKGFEIRKERALAGLKMKEEKEKAAAPLRVEKESLRPEKDALEAKKKELEEAERVLVDAHKDKWNKEKEERKKLKASAYFTDIDADKDQKITIVEMEKLEYLDSNMDGVVSEEEIKIYLTVDAADFDHFLTNMYDSLHSAKKNHQMEKRRKEEEAKDNLDGQEEHLDEEIELADDEEEDEHEEVQPPYDDATKAAVDAAEEARRAVTDFEIKFGTYDSQIREAEEFLKQDYGDDFAWASLKGQCYELNDMQYIYRLCPFDKAIQKDKNGHGETTLGYWKEWSGAVPRKYSAQSYTEGQQCWNGPRRSTHVVIECGETDELVETSEPAKCEYQFKFKTPVACNDPDKPEPSHTEL